MQSNLTLALQHHKSQQFSNNNIMQQVNIPAKEGASKDSLLCLPTEVLFQILEDITRGQFYTKIDIKKTNDLRLVCKHFNLLMLEVKTPDGAKWTKGALSSYKEHKQKVVNVANNKINPAKIKGMDLTLGEFSTNNFPINDLEGTIFARTKVVDINFQNKNLQHTVWDKAICDQSNYNGANMSHSSAIKTSFVNAHLQAVNLDYTDLTDSDFSGADLRYTNLTFANIKNIIIDEKTKLEGTQLPEGITREFLLQNSKKRIATAIQAEKKISGSRAARAHRKSITENGVGPIAIPKALGRVDTNLTSL